MTWTPARLFRPTRSCWERQTRLKYHSKAAPATLRYRSCHARRNGIRNLSSRSASEVICTLLKSVGSRFPANEASDAGCLRGVPQSRRSALWRVVQGKGKPTRIPPPVARPASSILAPARVGGQPWQASRATHVLTRLQTSQGLFLQRTGCYRDATGPRILSARVCCIGLGRDLTTRSPRNMIANGRSSWWRW